MANSRILFVDDDDLILKGIVRQHEDDFDITIAVGPRQALQILADQEPFAVVVAEMRLPDMNGVQLLKRVRELQPDSVRMILTEFEDIRPTIEAVNEGNIFRFLAKPCDEDLMAAALQAGLRQYELIKAEHELVQGTLRGCVKVLAEILSLVSPLAFGQSTRVSATVDGILKRVEVPDRWQLEIAAMLSSLGCVTLSPELLKKKLDGSCLTPEEQSQFKRHPDLASELIRNIPRMEEVSAIIAGQSSRCTSQAIQRKSEILNLALAYDYHELSSESSLHALAELKQSGAKYDPDLLDALEDFVKQERNVEIREVEINEIIDGMVVAEDIRNSNGTLMMSKGQKITPSAKRLLQNFAKKQAISEVIKIVIADNVCTLA